MVANGEALLAPSVTSRLIAGLHARPPRRGTRPAGLDELTPRELEVFKLVARGMSNTDIARTLVVAETTVETDVTRGARQARPPRTGSRPSCSRTSRVS